MHCSTSLTERILKICSERQWTIGFAESCTGGQLSSKVVEQPGISKVFRGSVVAYDNEVKKSLLDVSNSDLQTFGAVSEEVAEAMALGALKALNCNWAVSITGIAGPDGGSEKKPVGTVCFSIIGLDYVRNVHILKRSERKLFKGNRQDIQTQAVDHALLMLESALLLSPSNSQA